MLVEGRPCVYSAGNITKSENHCLILKGKEEFKQPCNANNNDNHNTISPQEVSSICPAQGPVSEAPSQLFVKIYSILRRYNKHI